MDDVTDRATRRRAARQARKTPVTINVRNQIAVVPIDHIETYFKYESVSEWRWASQRAFILLRPREDMGVVRSDWLPRMLDRMRETRRRKGTIPVRIATGEGPDIEVDVGMIDVSVYFTMPPGITLDMPSTEAEFGVSLDENLRHLDSVCAGGLHDQMIVGMALHRFHSDGSPLLHYHNLIFGLRQEVRGGMDILGPLDLNPLLKTIARSGPVRIIGGMKQ